MPKIEPWGETGSDATIGYNFICPGCRMVPGRSYWHGFWVAKPNVRGAQWTFSGDMENPTFSPSLNHDHVTNPDGYICHLHVIDGKINYCSDCTHPLSGQEGIEMIDTDADTKDLEE